MLVLRWVLACALLGFAALCLTVTCSAHAANLIASRRRHRMGIPDKGAPHVSGLPLMAALAGVPAAVVAPVSGVRIAALIVVAIDVLPIALALARHARA
jgi:hypothetical protein